MAFLLPHVRARGRPAISYITTTIERNTMHTGRQSCPAHPLPTSVPALAAQAKATDRAEVSSIFLRRSRNGVTGANAACIPHNENRYAGILCRPFVLRFLSTEAGGSSSSAGVRELTMDDIVITKACADRLKHLKEEAGDKEVSCACRMARSLPRTLFLW